MKENLIQLVYVLLGITIVVLLLSNENHTGRYVPFANKMILDTTNGDVYLPIKGKSTKYIWEKYFAFQPKKELQAQIDPSE